jgi:hypothetical protein
MFVGKFSVHIPDYTVSKRNHRIQILIVHWQHPQQLCHSLDILRLRKGRKIQRMCPELRSWRTGNFPLKCRCMCARLHGVICYSMVNFIYSPKINWSFLNHKTFTLMTTGISIFCNQISNLFQLKRLKLKEWRKHNLNLE